MFRQCLLANGSRQQTSWIPSLFAYVGAMLRLREAGAWEDGWTVRSVGTACEESLLPDVHLFRREVKARGKG